MRSKLTDLHNYLKSKLDYLKIKTENFESVIGPGSIAGGSNSTSVDGLNVCDYRYSGTLNFESLPNGSFPYLLVMIRVWLDNNDYFRPDHGLPDPEIDVFDVDDHHSDVEISIEFIDNLYMKEAEDGFIEINGKMYKPGSWELLEAESVTVENART